jgi:hypothetical protein
MKPPPHLQINLMDHDSVVSMDLAFRIGEYLRSVYKQGDVIQQATIMLMALQEKVGLPQTGVLKVEW